MWRCKAFLGRGTVPGQGGLVTTIVSQTAYGKAKATKLLTDAVVVAAPIFAGV